MKPIAIIPARGGSKRLPRKNILPISGRPMITYPIQSAINSELFSRVLVSTEDNEIAMISEEAGAEVFIRSEKLATDTSTVAEVCTDVLNSLNFNEGFFCCIYPTAIFLESNDFIASYNLLKANADVDCVMGVSEYNLQPHQAMFEEDGILKPMWPELIRKQSQRIKPLIASNGTLYWSGTEWFLENKNYYSGKIKAYEIPYYRAVDIDTPEDYKFVKELFHD